MRIGGPARKHGVPDADIWHGVRNATHKIDMDEDLTMLIGPAREAFAHGLTGRTYRDPRFAHRAATSGRGAQDGEPSR